MDIHKAKDNYWRIKRVYEIALDGDSHDDRSILIKSCITPFELSQMKELIEESEDYGIHLI